MQVYRDKIKRSTTKQASSDNNPNDTTNPCGLGACLCYQW